MTPGERLTCETHLASCLRCQEQVAYLIRVSEADLPPESESAAMPALGAHSAWFRWAWASAALVAVIVGGTWYVSEYRAPHLALRQTARVKPAVPAPPSAPQLEGQKAAVQPSAPTPEKIAKVARSEESASEAAKPAARAAPKAKIAPPESGLQYRTGRSVPGPAPMMDEGTGGSRTAPTVGGFPIEAPPAASQPGPAGKGAIATPTERAQIMAGTPMSRRAAEQTSEHKEAQKAATSQAPIPRPTVSAESADELALLKDKIARERVAGRAGPQGNAPRASAMTATKSLAARATVGWRVGPHGLIQKADAHGNWVTQESGVEVDLYDIAFPSSSVGWAVGQSGTILRTTDGGKTWSKLTIPTTEDLIRVSGTGEQEARVETRSGLTFATMDGAKTWKPSRQP